MNKIDRGGAERELVLHGISSTLTSASIPMGSTHELGTRGADFTPYVATDGAFMQTLADLVADHDDALLAAYVSGVSDHVIQQSAGLAFR